MDEKRKPFATIYITKPRLPIVISLLIVFAILSVAASAFLQDRNEQAVKLEALEDNLQSARSGLQNAEAQLASAQELLETQRARIDNLEPSLQQSENRLQASMADLQIADSQLEEALLKLKQAPPLWQVHEPLAFHVTSGDAHGGVRIMRALACSRMPRGYESYVYLGSQETEIVDDLITGGEYTLVGKRKWSKNWTYGEKLNEDYYMRKEVFEVYPFAWSKSKMWTVNEFGWYDHVHSYCNDNYSPLQSDEERFNSES